MLVNSYATTYRRHNMKNILIGMALSLTIMTCQAKSSKCCELTHIRNILTAIQNSIVNILNFDLCGSTPITAATTITVPGNYCLANDVTGGITIASPNVALNLNNFTLSGSIVINASQVTVSNGVLMGNATGTGIYIGGTTSDAHIHDVIINNFINGILGLGGARNIVITNVTSRNNIGSSSHGVYIDAATNVVIKDSQFNNNQVTGLLVDNSSNVIIDNCTANGNGIGFSDSVFISPINNTNVLITNCFASSNGIGFSISGQDTLVIECDASSSTNIGFAVQGLNTLATSATLLKCNATDNANAGFSIQATGTPTSVDFWLEDCISNNNGIGFNQTLTTGVIGTVKACSASNNTGCGFNDVTGSAIHYASNYSADNGTNYCVASTSVAAATTPYFYVTPIAGATYWDNVSPV